ncbi:MAG: PilZ domain-containing protein [Magnetococcus sp. YQC-5]
MDKEQERSDTSSRRRHERVYFKYQAVLELAGGKTFWGITQDVSLRGLFLNVTGVPAGVEVGDVGLLRLTVLNLKKEFPCRVAHVRNAGIGIELFDKGENFGATLTATLLQETHVRLGADVDAHDAIKVVLRALPSSLKTITPTTTLEARLVKISVSHMEFIFSALAGWSLEPGMPLHLEILKTRHAPILVEAVVRSVVPAHDRECSPSTLNDKICAVVFSVMPDHTASAIKELVRTLHSRRLQLMMQQRSMSIGLQAGPDQPLRTRPAVRRDLERFFGARP